MYRDNFERARRGFNAATPTIWDIFNRPLSDFAMSGRGNDGEEGFKVDIRDLGDHYLLEADLPGVNKSDLSLSFEDGILRISARHHVTEGEEPQGYVLHERSSGVYRRAFRFEDLDGSKVEAEFKEGVLRISAPKVTARGACNIEIH